MAVYLPVLTVLLAGVSLAGGSVTLLISLGTVGVVLYLALRHGRHISRAVSSDNPEMLLLVVLGLTVLVAGLAQRLQVSAAVGAFLVGIALSGEVAEGARKILAPLRDLFAAVFFLFFGLSTAPGAIPRCCCPHSCWRSSPPSPRSTPAEYAAGRASWAAAPVPGGRRARRPRRVLHRHRGLAVGTEPRIGPFATAYVLILVMLGPFTARWTQPALYGLRDSAGPLPPAAAPEAVPGHGSAPRPRTPPPRVTRPLRRAPPPGRSSARTATRAPPRRTPPCGGAPRAGGASTLLSPPAPGPPPGPLRERAGQPGALVAAAHQPRQSSCASAPCRSMRGGGPRRPRAAPPPGPPGTGGRR